MPTIIWLDKQFNPTTEDKAILGKVHIGNTIHWVIPRHLSQKLDEEESTDDQSECPDSDAGSCQQQ